jgi:hypothetical protein
MDEILRQEIQYINKCILIKLPNKTMTPQEFLTLNETHIKETMKIIKKKSLDLENLFQYIIQLILYRIKDKYSVKDNNKLYDFFNIAKALENVRDTDVEITHKGGFI